MLKFSFIFLIFLGCKSQKPDPLEAWQDESAVKLLLEDKANKELELVYLHEIRKAMHNDDEDAFEFYFNEYISVPRLEIPEELKSHPDYFIGGERVKY